MNANLLANGSHDYRATSPASTSAPVDARVFTTYLLAGGRGPVQIDEDIARGAAFIDFQLADGTIVKAKRASEPGSDEAFDFIAAAKGASSGLAPMHGPVKRHRSRGRGPWSLR